MKKRAAIRKLETTHPDSTRSARTVRLVVAALILRHAPEGHMEVLIGQRKPEQPMSLKWEFPGGKIEPGEGPEEALRRELDEELGIQAEIGPQLTHIRHNYRNGGAVDLRFFVVRSFAGEMQNKIFQQIRWSSFDALPDYDFLAADLGLIKDLAEGNLAV